MKHLLLVLEIWHKKHHKSFENLSLNGQFVMDKVMACIFTLATFDTQSGNLHHHAGERFPSVFFWILIKLLLWLISDHAFKSGNTLCLHLYISWIKGIHSKIWNLYMSLFTNSLKKLRNFGSLPMKCPGTKLQAVIMLISEFLGDFTNFVGFVNTT